jgi:hypothetical protein
MYQIKVEYETGDSFGRSDEQEILRHSWSNLDIAKENLQRIKEHYLWANNWQPERKAPSFLEDTTHYGRWDINLLNDERNEVRFGVSWVGYFETLYGASIIADEKDGWSFRL